MPRHPPCALNNLATKMLASTVQFSKYGQDHAVDSPRTQNPTRRASLRPSGATAPHEPTHLKGHPQQPGRSFPQDPTVCREANPSPTTTFHAPTREAVLARPVPRPTTRCQRSTHRATTPGTCPSDIVWTRSWPWTTTTPTHTEQGPQQLPDAP